MPAFEGQDTRIVMRWLGYPRDFNRAAAESIRINHEIMHAYLFLKFSVDSPIAVLGFSLSLAGAVHAAKHSTRTVGNCVDSVITQMRRIYQ